MKCLTLCSVVSESNNVIKTLEFIRVTQILLILGKSTGSGMTDIVALSVQASSKLGGTNVWLLSSRYLLLNRQTLVCLSLEKVSTLWR